MYNLLRYTLDVTYFAIKLYVLIGCNLEYLLMLSIVFAFFKYKTIIGLMVCFYLTAKETRVSF